MSEEHAILTFGDVNELAHKIREFIGVGDFEPVTVLLSQFDRTDNRVVVIHPNNNAEWLDTLKTAPVSILRDLGLQNWDDDLWLYPAEWYDYIPDGYEVIDINGNTECFRKGETDDDRRYGALAFGCKIGNINAEQVLKANG